MKSQKGGNTVKTVKEVSRLTGVSVRMLHHYDAVGLLKPSALTEAGYRLYNEEALERLYLILVFRELGFSLRDIRRILDAPDYDRNRVLEQQISLLETKVAHLQNRIQLARGIQLVGIQHMDWSGFDSKKLDDCSEQVKKLYSKTDIWQEYTHKSENRTQEQEHALDDALTSHFSRLGQLRHLDPGSEPVQSWVAGLQAFISEHYYHCTNQILLGLGQMYAGGGSLTENIAEALGAGTGEFMYRAITIYCGGTNNG